MMYCWFNSVDKVKYDSIYPCYCAGIVSLNAVSIIVCKDTYLFSCIFPLFQLLRKERWTQNEERLVKKLTKIESMSILWLEKKCEIDFISYLCHLSFSFESSQFSAVVQREPSYNEFHVQTWRKFVFHPVLSFVFYSLFSVANYFLFYCFLLISCYIISFHTVSCLIISGSIISCSIFPYWYLSWISLLFLMNYILVFFFLYNFSSFNSENNSIREFLDSSIRIEAAIVRIMKARKRLPHNSLVNEVSWNIDSWNYT